MNQQTIFKQTEIGKIPEDWEVKKIENLCDISSSKRIFYSEYVKKGIPFYRSKEIIEKSNGNHISTELFISTEKYEEIKNKYGIPIPGDLLLTSVGTLGIPYIVQEEDKFYFKDGNLTWFKNFKNLNVKYLYYWFNSKFGKDCLNAISIGSTQKALTIKALKNIDLIVPPPPEQHAIAKILSDLDSKIELLQKQNKTLEAIAQALFKHWFVDFEFPNEEGKPYKSSGGEMVDSELGAIPKDWKVNQLKDFGDIICGKTPPKSNKEYFEGDIPFIKIPDMHNQLFVINTEDSLTKEGKEYQENKTIPEKSICVSCIATVGLVSLTSKESQTNQQINSIIPKNSYSTYYLHYMLKSMYQLLQDYGSGGSATLNINTKTFSKIKVLSPKDEVIKEFYKKVNSIFDKILNNLNENNILSQIRDSLLPKLMSGKIRVKEFA